MHHEKNPTTVAPEQIDPLDPPRVVAVGMGVSTQTLANWRCTRRMDLPFVKIGRMVRYRRSVWRAFAEATPDRQAA